MANPGVYSASWYRVKDLRPRLRPHVEVHRHRFRGETWYVLQDHATGQFFRFSRKTWSVIGLMDGERTVDEIWTLAAQRLGDDMPTQDEVIQLLGQLHKVDALLGDVPPALRELDERARLNRRERILNKIRNPIFLRIPLFDPDRFLAVTLPYVRPLFSRTGFVIWAVIVLISAVMAVMHWDALTGNLLDRVLSSGSVLLLIVLFPPLKLLHELGHGWAVRRFGGEVHEIGVMLLVLMPIPYVEASSSAAFRSKWARVAVGGAGMMTELLIAAIAFHLWLAAEPGLLKAACFNMMLIAGVSTVFFNGNPLARFDAYYMLSDFLEIPNLGSRSVRWWGYLAERYLFGVSDAQSPAESVGEARWFAIYGPASFAYRMALMAIIALYVASAVPLVGVALAIWTLVLAIVLPLYKGLRHVLTHPRLEPVRRRAVGTTAGALAAALILLFVVPVPSATVAQGVVWAPPAGRITAAEDGFVREVLVGQEEKVARGTPILEMVNPVLQRERKVRQAKLKRVTLERSAADATNVAKAQLLQKKVDFARRDLAFTEERSKRLELTSPRGGRVRFLHPGDLDGAYLRRGEIVAYVMQPGGRRVHIVVPQKDIDLVRNHTQRIDLRLARDLDTVIESVRVVREVPSGDRQLPSPALALSAGGPLPLDPGDPKGKRVLETFYLLEVALPMEEKALGVGERVYARFDHGDSPLATQLWRLLRQTFLKRLEL